MCVPLTKFSPYTGAVVLGFLEPKNKLFIDGEVRTLLGTVACWLPAAPQPEGVCLCFNESCFVSFFFFLNKKKATVTVFAAVFLCDGIGGLQKNVGWYQNYWQKCFKVEVCMCWVPSKWHPHTTAGRVGSPVSGALPFPSKWDKKLALKVFWALKQFLLVLIFYFG